MASRNQSTHRIVVGFLAFSLFACTMAPGQTGSATDDALYTQALQAYSQNQFSQADALFAQVSGVHAQEAAAYRTRIKNYKDVMGTATGIMSSSPEELDIRNVEYAIQQFQKAMEIKSDGPGNPAKRIEEARKIANQLSASSNALHSSWCQKTLAASESHDYADGKRLACLLAAEDADFRCGESDARHLCAAMSSRPERTPEAVAPSGEPAGSAEPGVMAKVKAAFDRNEFDRARTLLQRVTPEERAEAQEYLEKINRYQQFMRDGERFAQDLHYSEAVEAYQSALSIKPDGPGDPQTHASLTALEAGIDKFYSGDYARARELLQLYQEKNAQHSGADTVRREGLLHFYLGACSLAEFYLEEPKNQSLQEAAMAEFKLARKTGFLPKAEEISPKILDVYQQIPPS